jgi:hypothetical protein
MARHSQRDGNEHGADRRIDACLRLPRMAVLHPRAGRSRIKSESDFARVYATGIGIWLSLVGRPQPPHRVGHTIGRGRRRCGSRVLGVGARPLPHSLKAAALCGAAPMATPFVHGHDLCVLAIAVAFLVKDGLARGFLPGDRSIVLFSWIVMFLGFRDFSSGWIPCLALLALVVRRATAIVLRPQVLNGSALWSET